MMERRHVIPSQRLAGVGDIFRRQCFAPLRGMKDLWMRFFQPSTCYDEVATDFTQGFLHLMGCLLVEGAHTGQLGWINSGVVLPQRWGMGRLFAFRYNDDRFIQNAQLQTFIPKILGRIVNKKFSHPQYIQRLSQFTNTDPSQRHSKKALGSHGECGALVPPERLIDTGENGKPVSVNRKGITEGN